MKKQNCSQLLCFALFVLFVFSSCKNSDEPQEPSIMHGSAALQTKLAVAAAPLRPIGLIAGSSFNLDNSSGMTITVDMGSNAWYRITFETQQAEKIPKGEDLLAYSRGILAKYSEELMFLPDEIAEDASALHEADTNLRMVTFQRRFLGVPVHGAFVQFFYNIQDDGSYRLIQILNNSYGPVKLGSDNAPELTNAEALAIAGLDNYKVSQRKEFIQPSTTTEGHYDFSLATEFEFVPADVAVTTYNPLSYTVMIDRATHAIHRAFPNRLDIKQSVSAESYIKSYILADQSYSPLPYVSLLDGANKLETDALGQADVNGTQVTVTLKGSKSAAGILDLAVSNNAFATFAATLSADGKSNLTLKNTDPSVLNTYMAIERVRTLVAKYLSETELPLLKTGILAVVNGNDPANFCNAYYDPNLKNLYLSKAGAITFKDGTSQKCESTGLISDAIYHEWGHAMDDQLGPTNIIKGNGPGGKDRAYGEGIGDTLSALTTRTSTIGEGLFVGDKRPLRNAQNTARYNAGSINTDEHVQGLIFSGSFWDLYTNFTALYGVEKGADLATNYFLKHLQINESYLTAYDALVLVDSGNGALGTKGPNYCNITRAFQAHNLSGTATVADDCIDADTSLKVRVDLDSGDGKLSLLASAGGATKIIACPGAVKVCAASGMGYIEMTVTNPDGKLTASKVNRFYTAQGTFDVKANPVYSFFSLDAKGVKVGMKTLNFKAKASTLGN
ncbi:MAG: hypothetical protein H7249_20320 [Chitinophagaceae bacterium]|nr:hypothetical protein [Oligoflexus sp.]